MLANRLITHHPDSGFNPLVDRAAYLFTLIARIKHIKWDRQLKKLQKDLNLAFKTFEQTSAQLGYPHEQIVICRYALSATIDDLIAATVWHKQWMKNLSTIQGPREETFFTILTRLSKNPSQFIDILELMYLCLSLGYKGPYRNISNGPIQLEQITDRLYKHIRRFRGNTSKTLSPFPMKAKRTLQIMPRQQFSPLFIFLVTTCMILTIFIGLSYLTDVISNEAYQHITAMQKSYPIQRT